ncbi:MAG: acyl-CoA carboxylase subunit beta [Candidatus Dormiibacterota bacterium]
MTAPFEPGATEAGGDQSLRDELQERRDTALRGGPERYRSRLPDQHKLPVRERLRLLFDPATPFIEDGLLANTASPEEMGADGLVTGIGTVHGRRVCVAANDPTVKAGSWGPLTVEKFLRIQEQAERLQLPLCYLVDSAGARITEQRQMFPGRRHAGRIFHNQVRLSGQVPQPCVLLGPSAAGGAYIPAFCDVTFMVEGNASMYLGSPRMAQEVVGEHVSLEEMGGARMHCTVSGCGDLLLPDEASAIAALRSYLAFFPSSWRGEPPAAAARQPSSQADIGALLPREPTRGYDIHLILDALLDGGSFFEIKPLYARELVCGLGRLGGRAVGVVASQPEHQGGVLFVDSSDKAARFISLCDAFNLPLVFLADVPGFMIGSVVEREGIIRHGAKMIAALSSATVPRICVVLRKAYGAGLYAMSGPAFQPEATLALPTAEIAVMGPEAAINAVYANRIAALPEAERPEFVARLRAEYSEDVDVFQLASDLILDAVVEPGELRDQLIWRLAAAATKVRRSPERHHGVFPV